FIIHGRQQDAVRALSHFLTALGLHASTFDRVRSNMGGTPTLLDVVQQGVRDAQAVLVLLTPDEASWLEPNLKRDGDKHEDASRWQPRPNVLFEAGLAIGLKPNETILVTIGSAGLPSDLSGLHVLSLD